MIVITGAAGFIAHHLLRTLNQAGYRDLVLVDNFSVGWKLDRLEQVRFRTLIHRDRFLQWLARHGRGVEFVFHLGGKRRGPYAELYRWNTRFSRHLWRHCVRWGIPLIYTSSATTFGRADHGQSDDHRHIPRLRPTTPYGRTKQAFDRWAVYQTRAPFFWAGLKLMQVYGPMEGPPGTGASMIYKAYRQIRSEGKVTLFESPVPHLPHGEMMRDFIYVTDVVDVMMHFFNGYAHLPSGIYNVGTGVAASFNQMARLLFSVLQRPPTIEYRPMPSSLRTTFPLHIHPPIAKLRTAGFQKAFTPLHQGIAQYVISLNNTSMPA